MKRHALMIGVNDYGSEGALDFARSDAEFVGNAFRRQYDRTVVVSDRDATKTAVISELEQLTLDLNKGDVAFVYFSGHGSCAGGDHAMVLPNWDARGRRGKSRILTCYEIASQFAAKELNWFFVLDCCQQKAIDFPMWRRKGKNCGNPYIHPPLILSSCAPGQLSRESRNQRHGYFTRAFVDALYVCEKKTFMGFCACLDQKMESLRLIGEQTPYLQGWVGACASFWPQWQ